MAWFTAWVAGSVITLGGVVFVKRYTSNPGAGILGTLEEENPGVSADRFGQRTEIRRSGAEDSRKGERNRVCERYF